MLESELPMKDDKSTRYRHSTCSDQDFLKTDSIRVNLTPRLFRHVMHAFKISRFSRKNLYFKMERLSLPAGYRIGGTACQTVNQIN